MKKQKLKSGLFALVSLVLVSACGLRPPDPLTPTPVPTPTPMPTPTCTPTVRPRPEGDYQVRAWVAFERPGLDQIQTVYGKLIRGDEVVAGAQMYSVVHYTKNDRRWPETGVVTAGENGIAEIAFSVMEADSEDPVPVDVYLIYGETIFHGATLFTPRC